ncbi:MAG: TetR family transcriptional regulator [Gammaproteobacteria bacterium]|nr:TetR family transcriptional regulator [Gammaproteobacteria bacterium]
MTDSRTTLDAVQPRRLPQQARSRARYDQVLAAASELIGERGVDAVSVREIAEAAGVPIAFIYDYFPDRNALLWTLVAAPLERFEREYKLRIAAADTPAALSEAAVAGFDAIVTELRSEPAIVRIWSGVQAIPMLAELDRAQNERLAEAVADRMLALDPETDHAAVRRRALLLCTLASAAIDLALGMEGDDVDAILTEFRGLLRDRIATFN